MLNHFGAPTYTCLIKLKEDHYGTHTYIFVIALDIPLWDIYIQIFNTTQTQRCSITHGRPQTHWSPLHQIFDNRFSQMIEMEKSEIACYIPNWPTSVVCINFIWLYSQVVDRWVENQQLISDIDAELNRWNQHGPN